MTASGARGENNGAHDISEKDARGFMLKKAGGSGIELTAEQIEKFMRYVDLLLERNKIVNLTAITDIGEIIVKHFIDSLSALKYMDFSRGRTNIIDIGSGAGFPGMPFAIVKSGIDMTLVDANLKKINFLTEAVKTLGLFNVNIIRARAEEIFKKPEFFGKYDYAFCRSLAPLIKSVEWCLPFVRPGGEFLAFKGPKAFREAGEAETSIERSGGELKGIKPACIPGLDHYIVVIIKKTGV